MRHSQADIGKVMRLLGYAPTHRIGEGLERAMPWYVRRCREQSLEMLPRGRQS